MLQWRSAPGACIVIGEPTTEATMLVTVLEAHVPAGREDDLLAAFAAAGRTALPTGLVRSALLRDTRDPARWRIETVWTSREALDAMRSAGTPAGVLMFRAAGAEPQLSVFEAVSTIGDER
jgi:quinol monooxygenase YgiN